MSVDDQPDDAALVTDTAAESDRIHDSPPRHTPLWALLSGWLLGAEAWLRSHGGRRLRLTLRGFWAAVALGGIVLLVGPVINPPLTLDDITGSAETVTDTWIARTFAADYRVERMPDGTLVTRVEERIGALFTDDTDENGIVRVLATQYQGHSLDPSDIEATMDGAPVEIDSSETPEQLTLAIDGEERLSGDHEFVLRYDLRHLAYETTDTATDKPVDLLEWDVLGPQWEQALAAIDVTITLPDEIDSELLRQPRGNLYWTIIGDGAWLEPEPDSPEGEVTYRFTNEQNIPPYADAWFTMSFEPGTFTMPAPSTLFWIQTFGPLAPLAFLLVTLLLAFAARAVAWSDARGRPWFVAQSDPPRGVSPRMAAQVLRAPLAMELADALFATRKSTVEGTSRRRRNRRAALEPQRRELLLAAALVARRTGTIGDRPRALSHYLRAAERREQLAEGIRRIPEGFVRDLFIAAPIALTIVQWGLVRQLSYQAKLAVVWWPGVFVLASTLIAAVIVGIAVRSRPLTRHGAIVKQYLLGVGVYAEQTRLLERGDLTEKVLPYAVLLAPPRQVGEKIVEAVEGDLGETGVTRGWRTRDFLTPPRLLIRFLSLLLVAGAITAVATLPDPYPRNQQYISYEGDVPGALWTKVNAIDIVGELSRTDDGRARLDVTESLEVAFEDGSSRVPQFAHQWPNIVDGQELDLVVSSVTVDGQDVRFSTSQADDTLLLTTRLVTALTGTHDIAVRYTVGSAAVAASEDGDTVDRVRWAALLDGWEYSSQWGSDPSPDPLRIELRVSEELAALAEPAGWITLDTDSADRPRDWKQSVVPFDSWLKAGESRVYELDLQKDEYGTWPDDLTRDDIGASMDFPEGTFAGPDQGALRVSGIIAVAPMFSVVTLAILALLLGFAGAVSSVRKTAGVFTNGVFRDAVRWLAPAATLAVLILFFWATADMVADHAALVPLGLSALAAVAGTVIGLVFSRASQRPR